VQVTALTETSPLGELTAPAPLQVEPFQRSAEAPEITMHAFAAVHDSTAPPLTGGELAIFDQLVPLNARPTSLPPAGRTIATHPMLDDPVEKHEIPSGTGDVPPMAGSVWALQVPPPVVPAAISPVVPVGA
jgi:hypothetical protein